MPARGGQGAIDHQRRAHAEHRQRDDLRQPRTQRGPAGAGGTGTDPQRLAQCRAQRQQGGQQQRQHVIGDPVDQRGRKHRRRCHLRQQLEQAPLEHAQPGRHAGDQAGQHRHQVQADEAGQAGRGVHRQQHIKGGAGQHQLDHAQCGHPEHGAAVGQPQRVAAYLETAPVAADQQQRADIPEQACDAQPAHRLHRYRQGQRGRARLKHERQRQQQPCAEHETQRAHQHHLADLAQAQPGAAIAAQADRAAGERGKAQGLAQGVGQEGGDPDPGRMQSLAAAAQADRIEPDQAGVTGQTEQHRQGNLPRAEMTERRADGAVTVFVEFAGQPAQGQGQDRQAEDDGGGASPGQACRGGRRGCFGHRYSVLRGGR
ncbi:hypothetical protein D3C71_1002470 [compost metagenome]